MSRTLRGSAASGSHRALLVEAARLLVAALCSARAAQKEVREVAGC